MLDGIDTASLFTVFAVEVQLALLGLVLIVVDLLLGRGRITGPATAVRLLAGLGLVAVFAGTLSAETELASTWGVLDGFSLYFKRFFLGTALLTLAISGPYEERMPAGRGEFPVLLIFTTLGMCMLSSVNDLVTLFVGLELVTIVLFLMAAWRPRLPRSLEAGIKFVIIGALAAAFMVYGIAFIYGSTGSFELGALSAALNGPGDAPGALRFGLLLVLVGLGFKLGAVPFHVWLPDVYQGAPTPVTALLSVGSKAAGVVLMMRLVYTVMGDAAAEWGALLAGLAALTLLMGGLGAIPQVDAKRFLAYSGIAHAGFLLMGLATHSLDSAGALLFYIVTYLFANMAAFLVIIVVSRSADNAHMDRLDGLAVRSPFLAFVLTVALLSLAGVPPFAGFFAKFMILRAAVDDPSLHWLVVFSLVMVVTSLYYYLCIVKRIYMREAKDTSFLEVFGGTRLLLLVCTLAAFAFGIYPRPLQEAAASAARALMG